MKTVIVGDSYLAGGSWPDAHSLLPCLFACRRVVCSMFRWEKNGVLKKHTLHRVHQFYKENLVIFFPL